MFADSVYSLPRTRTIRTPTLAVGADALAGIGLLSIALVAGLATAGDYGLTIDEFNTDDYGPKALAWYTSGFTDRSHFETVERYLWYYGPWHQILIAFVQSLNLTDPFTVRHAITFATGLLGLTALIPIARLSVGGWAGPIAILLCLMTGYVYGNLFFTPIDVPFMAAMSWSLCAILMMTRREVPAWSATIATGLLTGIAMSTRTGGIIAHAYLLLAMALSALELALRQGRAAIAPISQIALRTLAAVALAWIIMIALWPWLQTGNPLQQFAIAYRHFTSNPMAFSFPSWGEEVWTNALPWHYIPGQFLARLPEGFLVLLGLALVIGLATSIRFGVATFVRWRERGGAGLVAPALLLARSRATLLVIAAAIVPIGYVIVTQATHYDGVRHLLFVIPMLALLAGGALLRLVPFLRRYPLIAATAVVAGLAHASVTVATFVGLHPIQYVAFNSLAGGTSGAAGRFELDYWAVGATEALRKLEGVVDRDRSGRFANRRARVIVCINNREWMADRLFRRDWVAETDAGKADFIITTERWDCARGMSAVLVGEVTRDGVTFARIYRNRTPVN